MQFILVRNGFEGLHSDETALTREKQMGDAVARFQFVNSGEEVTVTRTLNGIVKVNSIPIAMTRLYTHVMTPYVKNLGPIEDTGKYPKLSHTDPIIRLFLCMPGDLISVTRLVAYKTAGTQKNENLYLVV
jgi:hypothetical protein